MKVKVTAEVFIYTAALATRHHMRSHDVHFWCSKLDALEHIIVLNARFLTPNVYCDVHSISENVAVSKTQRLGSIPTCNAGFRKESTQSLLGAPLFCGKIEDRTLLQDHFGEL